MERQNEEILQNAKLENVMRYLSEKLKGIHNVTIDETLKDGTINHYSLYVYPVHSNKIKVEYGTSRTPKGDVQKFHGTWGVYPVMSFEGMQLQEDTVLIKAECERRFIVPTFDRYWADMLKDLGASSPTVAASTSDAIRQAAINSTSVIAGSEYDLLTSKELKHKAARFDALRHGSPTADPSPAVDAKDESKSPKMEVVEDTTGWDNTLIQMWNDGHTRDEIANRVHKSKDRVTNRITELRNKFGENIVPYNEERKKRLIKS